MTKIHTCGRLALAAALALSFSVAARAQTASRDTETGELRAPNADEVKALSGSASRPVGLVSGKSKLPQIRHADGTIQQELDTSSLMYSVAKRNPDGSISQYCVTGSDAAERLVKGQKVKAALVSKAGKEHNHEVK